MKGDKMIVVEGS